MDVDKFSDDANRSDNFGEDDFDFFSLLEEDIEKTVSEEPKKHDLEQEIKFNYGPGWHHFPEFLIPYSLIWYGLDQLAEKLRIAPKLSKRHPQKGQTVEKWLHRINCMLAFVITCAVLVAILVLLVAIGVDVSNW